MRILTFTLLAPLVCACGKTDADAPRGSGQDDATPVPELAVGEEFTLSGTFPESGGDGEYSRRIEAAYSLKLENKVALMVASEEHASVCETGAEVIGPFYSLVDAEGKVRSTDERAFESAAKKEDFPGVVEAGTYQFTVQAYSQGDCQFDYRAVLQPRSDISVLEPGEWDHSLQGDWIFSGWDGAKQSWRLEPGVAEYRQFAPGGKLTTHVEYTTTIDGSEIPGRLLLKVSRVHLLDDLQDKQKIGDQRACIYRVFPGYEGTPALWWTCVRGDSYPDTFEYPLKEWNREGE